MINEISKPKNIRSVEDISSYFRNFLQECMTYNGYPPSLDEAYVLQIWDIHGKNLVKNILEYSEGNTEEIHRDMIGFIHQFIGDPVTCKGGWFEKNLIHDDYYQYFKHDYALMWCSVGKEFFISYLIKEEEEDDVWIKMCKKMRIS